MKLSIITRHNNIIGLEKTMWSVLQQTATDFEYIIIDGASSAPYNYIYLQEP